ncbi:MAG: NADH-quinone oxidoreductase subunit N, partial [Acidimicrobiales bacterium]
MGLLLAASGPLKLPPVAYSAILPELILIGTALGFLGVAALTRARIPAALWSAGTILAGLASLATALVLWSRVSGHAGYTAIDGAVVVDGFSVLFLVLVSCAEIVFALIAAVWMDREDDHGPEMLALALLSGSGAMLMAEANDLILIFLGLEILSIALYVLAALNRRRSESGEAAIKYFVLGAFSSAIFLYGVALTYGATGSTNIGAIARYLAQNVVTSNGVLLAGLFLLIAGLAFKVAAVPFHAWTPDVYQGSPSPVTGFMAAVAKAGGFAALLRVCISSFGTLRLDWQPAIYALAVLSLVLGAVLAVIQSDVKRMLAYSSISHAGFVLLGLEAVTSQGVSGAEYYLFTYAFMILGSFAVVTVVGAGNDVSQDISLYRGLGSRRPVLALGFAVLLLAQAGVPFTTG